MTIVICNVGLEHRKEYGDQVQAISLLEWEVGEMKLWGTGIGLLYLKLHKILKAMEDILTLNHLKERTQPTNLRLVTG
jgi:hypothetical protein